MSIVLNMVGGGGGLNVGRPLIHVNAPVGSTVTFTLSGLIVKSITPDKAFTNSDGVTADYYYANPANGTYTVTSTQGAYSATDTVVVSENKQYDITILYQIMMFDRTVDAFSMLLARFNQCGNSSYQTITDDTDKVLFQSAYGKQALIYKTGIDLSNYSVLEAGGYINQRSTQPVGFGISSSSTSIDAVVTTGFDSYSYQVVDIDIAALTGIGYPMFYLAAPTQSNSIYFRYLLIK